MEKRFIAATQEPCSFAKHIPAPYLRRSFQLTRVPQTATASICGLGFYRLWINGTEITKGYFAPYISNPEHLLYYDTYEVAPYLKEGENVIGVLLGNGFQNPFGGAPWDFDSATWLASPRMAFSFLAEGEGERLAFYADEQFVTHASPILFDEYRMGEIYDARNELAGWNLPGYDATGWAPALLVEPPKGELRECRAEPIRCYETLTPISVTPYEGGYLYDFGKNTAGVCRLHLSGATPGQTVVIKMCERLQDGRFDQLNLFNKPETYSFYYTDFQRLEYRARGGDEEYEPSFAWFGYRYALVMGITPEQATKALLSYPVLSSALPRVGEFSCSDQTVMQIYHMIENSDLSNFYYFPTDCPHREKNGWTGDASFSAPQMSLLFDTTESYTEWLRSILAAQREDGALPGIVPTGGWGFAWGNGPAWDSVLFRLPYFIWRFRGKTEAIRLCADAMLRYLRYVQGRRSEDGTIAIGLGDWAPVGRKHGRYLTPLVVTDTILVMDLAKKAAEMLAEIGRAEDAANAAAFYREMRDTVRRVLLDRKTLTVQGSTQTAQAMGLYYGVFEPEEEPQAFAVLEQILAANNGQFDCGYLGMYVLFHVLSKFGKSEVAWRMVTQREYPSYRYLIDQGETSMVEAFQPEENFRYGSHNHHFFGDVLRWFFFDLAGLQICNSREIRVCPSFIRALDHAEATYQLPDGTVRVAWARVNGKLRLSVSHPAAVQCTVVCDRANCTVEERVLQ